MRNEKFIANNQYIKIHYTQMKLLLDCKRKNNMYQAKITMNLEYLNNGY